MQLSAIATCYGSCSGGILTSPVYHPRQVDCHNASLIFEHPEYTSNYYYTI